MVWHGMVWYGMLWYCIALDRMELYWIASYCIVLHCIVLHCTVYRCIALRFSVYVGLQCLLCCMVFYRIVKRPSTTYVVMLYGIALQDLAVLLLIMIRIGYYTGCAAIHCIAFSSSCYTSLNTLANRCRALFSFLVYSIWLSHIPDPYCQRASCLSITFSLNFIVTCHVILHNVASCFAL